jgi:hypothetical protein
MMEQGTQAIPPGPIPPIVLDWALREFWPTLVEFQDDAETMLAIAHLIGWNPDLMTIQEYTEVIHTIARLVGPPPAHLFEIETAPDALTYERDLRALGVRRCVPIAGIAPDPHRVAELAMVHREMRCLYGADFDELQAMVDDLSQALVPRYDRLPPAWFVRAMFAVARHVPFVRAAREKVRLALMAPASDRGM